MRFFKVCFLLLFISACRFSSDKKSQFERNWYREADFSQTFSDTVQNPFCTIHDLVKVDTAIFDSVFFNIENFVWHSYGKGYFQVLNHKKTFYGKSYLETVRCRFAIDTIREDEASILMFIENFGLVYQQDVKNRTAYLLKDISRVDDKKLLFKMNIYEFINDTTFFPKIFRIDK